MCLECIYLYCHSKHNANIQSDSVFCKLFIQFFSVLTQKIIHNLNIQRIMNLEFATELDRILSGVPEKGGNYTLKNSVYNPESLGSQLQKDGYGMWLSENEFRILPEGVDYLKRGGYRQQVAFANGIRQQESELSRRQIQSLKREPYIIAWAIISTLTTLALTLMSLLFE